MNPHPLHGQRLRLTTELERRELPDGGVLWCRPTSGTYLAASPLLRPWLERLDGSRPVGALLQEVLRSAQRPSLHAFWSAITKGREAGILDLPDEPGPPARHAGGWRWGWPTAVAMILAGLGIFLGLGLLVSAPVPAMLAPAAALACVAAVSAGISLAHVFAMWTLHGLGRRSYRPRLTWRYLAPAFVVDTQDAVMAGRRGEMAVELARLSAPFWIGTIGALADLPPVRVAAWVTLLIFTFPWSDGPAHRLLHALTRQHYEHLDIQARLPVGNVLARLWAYRHQLRDRYVAAFVLYAVLWLGLLLLALGHLLTTDREAYLAALLNPTAPAEFWAASCSLALLSLLAAAPLVYQGWLLTGNLWYGLRHRFPVERALDRYRREQPPADAAAVLSRSALLGDLPPAFLAELLAGSTCLEVPAGTCLLRQGDRALRLYVLLAGAVAIHDADSPHGQALHTMTPGDLFGEAALSAGSVRSASAVAVGPAVLLAIAPDNLARLVSTHLGGAISLSRLQLTIFLKRVTLFADWPAVALAGIAEHFQARPAEDGEILLRQGEPNATFFLIVAGQVQVSRDGKPVTLLAEGDFCGEISLLTGQPANATLTAHGHVRLLTLSKEAFLSFLSRSALTSCAVEETAQRRAVREDTP